MGKSTPKAPAPPDPVATANAQASANTQAAITQAGLNRINQVSPQGTLSYSQNGVDANGIPQYTQTMAYSPEQQALYDQQNQIAQSLGGLAQNQIGRVQDAQNQNLDFSGMNPLQSSLPTGGLQNVDPSQFQAQTGVADAGGIQRTFGTGGPIQGSFTQGGSLTSNVQPLSVQQQLSYSGLGALPNGQDFNQAAQSASDAVYGQAASRLNPQYAQLENDMRSRLMNSGISENSQAFQREMDNFSRNRTDAYNQANFSAFGAGLAAQQQGYGQSLATRQQGVQEINNQGQFANSAQAQQFGQGQANAELNNSSQGQLWQQNLGAAQFGNQAQAQQFGQNQQVAAFGNAAQDQQYQQSLAEAGLYNQAQNQNYSQMQSGTAFNNQTQNQAFNQALAGYQLNNQVRQQQIDESSYLRNLPLNDIAALLGTGGGVQQPNFNPFAQVGVAAPDYQGAVYQNYNAANQQYQAAMQARSQGLGSIFGALGSLGGAAIMSDRRAKQNVRRVGELANGLATYVFNYTGSKATQFGVMAQEALLVIPEAVSVRPDGYYQVNYGKVW